MERMVVHLLSLSRVEAGIEVADRSRLLLPPLIQDCWRDLTTQAAERDNSLHVEVAADFTVETDRDKLRLVVTNLLSNAVIRGERGQGVRCFATQKNGQQDSCVFPRFAPHLTRVAFRQPASEHPVCPTEFCYKHTI